MSIHMGIDEAGLGPTLGPICWGGCVWQHPQDLDFELWERLAPLVSKPRGGGMLQLGDSKLLFTGARKLTKLEAEVLTWVGWALGSLPRSFRELWNQLAGTGLDRCAITNVAHPPWLLDALDYELPLRSDALQIEERIGRLTKQAQHAGLQSPKLGARVLSAEAFNRQLAAIRSRGGTKNNLAVEQAITLAKRLWDPARGVDRIVFDKMGGRNSYADFLNDFRPKRPILTLVESRPESHYRVVAEHSARTTTVGFVAKSESKYPSVALGACIAKYFREVIILAFQNYFATRYPSVKATAGYPQDAKRFLSDLKAQSAPELLASAPPPWVRRG